MKLRQALTETSKEFLKIILDCKTRGARQHYSTLYKRWLCRNDLFFLTCITGHEKIAQWGDFYRPFCDDISLMNWKVVDLKIHDPSEMMLKIDDELSMQRLYLRYRGYYKTTIVTICHTVQLLLNFANIHVVLCHNKQRTSSDNLVAIKNIFLTKPKLSKDTRDMLRKEYGVYNKLTLYELFPECIPKGKEWGSAEKFSLANRSDMQRPEDNVEAVGVDTEITGGHWQVAKKNDLVTEKAVNTEDQIKKTRDWDSRFNKGHFDQLNQPLQDYEGTRYHFADMYSSKRNDERINVTEVSIVKDLDKFKAGDDSQIEHPQRYSRKDIEDLMTDDMWVFMCFTENQGVLTTSGSKKIKDIKIGDNVYTHNRNIRPVVNKFIRVVNEPKYRIYLSGMPDYIECTGNHRFYIYKNLKYRGYNISDRNIKMAKTGNGNVSNTIIDKVKNRQEIWCRADELGKDDIALFPVEGVKSPNIKDFEFWWIVGRYLAEGCLNYSNNSICFCAGHKEEKILDRTRNYFVARGRKAKVYKTRTGFAYTVGDKEIFSELKKFGRYSHGKNLTKEAESLTVEYMEYLVQGYLSGDGYLWMGKRAVNSVSKELLLGFKRLLAKHNLVCIVRKVSDYKEWNIENRHGIGKPLYNLYISENPFNVWINREKRYLCSKIRKIEIIENIEPYPVYNIEVKDDHSYCLDGIIAKNCQLMLKPEDPEKMQFNQTMIQYYDSIPEGCFNYLLIDPATARKKKSDYTVMLVIGVLVIEDKVCKFVRDGIRDKIDSKKRVDLAIDLSIDYKVKDVGWEAIGFQDTDCFYFEERRRKEKFKVNVTEIKSHAMSKEDRIRGLIPEYSNEEWFWPEKGKIVKHSSFSGKSYDLTEEMEYELMQFPLSQHDDLLDSMTFLNRLNISKPIQRKMIEEYRGLTFADYHKMNDERRRKKDIWDNTLVHV